MHSFALIVAWHRRVEKRLADERRKLAQLAVQFDHDVHATMRLVSMDVAPISVADHVKLGGQRHLALQSHQTCVTKHTTPQRISATLAV